MRRLILSWSKKRPIANRSRAASLHPIMLVLIAAPVLGASCEEMAALKLDATTLTRVWSEEGSCRVAALTRQLTQPVRRERVSAVCPA